MSAPAQGMRARLAELACSAWYGRTTRLQFIAIAALTVPLKHAMDKSIGRWLGLDWNVDWFVQSMVLRAHDAGLLLPVGLASLPFGLLAVVVTLRRLRDARAPLWLVGLLLLPVVNAFLAAVLALLPSRPPLPREMKGPPPPPSKRSRRFAMAMALVVAVPLGVAWVHLGVSVFQVYAGALFLGVPFMVGFVAGALQDWRLPGRMAWSALAGVAAILLAGAVIFAIAMEGAICLAMAAPIAIPLGALGGMAGHATVRARVRRTAATAFSMVPLLVPALLGVEAAHLPAPRVHAVTSVIEVDAPPETTWKHVVSFSELPPPTELVFRAGVAHPLRAGIDGEGVGAIRRCVFSTGAFIEPIVAWDEPRLLRFTVTANPPPMEEWSLHDDVEPPHLSGYLRSHAGQFELTRLPGGRTRLEGTTWYEHGLLPEACWTQWSDAIIHRIHLRVLRHVASLAEAEACGRTAGADPSSLRGHELGTQSAGGRSR